MQFLKLWFLSKIIESSVHTILLSKYLSYLQLALRGEFYTHNTSVTMNLFKCLCQARKVSGHVYVRYNYGYLFSPVSTIFGFNSEIVPFLFFNVFSRLPLNYIVCTRPEQIRSEKITLFWFCFYFHIIMLQFVFMLSIQVMCYQITCLIRIDIPMHGSM